MSSAVRLWAIDGKGQEPDLITPAWESRQRCLAAFSDGPEGKLPPSQPGLQLTRKGVLVTAFGKNPDGDGLLLRLWEQAGSPSPCRVQFPAGLKASKALPCDLRGRPIADPQRIEGGRLDVTCEPFAPVSLLLMP